MRLLIGIVALLSAGLSYAAPMPMRQSQQFTVIDARLTTARSPGQLKSPSGQNLLRLDADMLLVSSERIRTTLLWELGLPREGGGKIRLVLYLASKPDDLIRVISSFSPEKWEYELDIPDQIEAQKLVRGIVGAVLLELANRGQGPKSAELPLWLVEGLTLHVISVAGPELVFGSVPIGSMVRIVRERRGLDYLEAARTVLRAHPPLSFSELAHPKPETLVGNKLQAYQYSAQLLVYELLHSNDGPAKLITMLRELPRCWNWETALLDAFSSEFKALLDVEKSWAVNVMAFTAIDPARIWSRVVCLDRLSEVLTVPSQIRVTADTMPLRKTLTLQQVITNWAFAAQVPVLQRKISLLATLRLNSPSDLVPLIDSYERTLASYLQKRSQAGRTPANRMEPTFNANLASQDVLKELELLDKRRKALRPEEALTVNSPTSH